MTSQRQAVELSALRDEDIHTLFSWINDRDTVMWNSAFAPVHFRNHVEWFEAVRRRSDLVIFGIRTFGENRLVGTCQLHSIHSVHRSAELQIRIGKAVDRGKGYGRQALTLLLRHGFLDKNLRRIQLNVFTDNLAAIRVYSRAGFREEGCLRQAAFIDGQFKDVLVMALLRSEFLER